MYVCVSVYIYEHIYSLFSEMLASIELQIQVAFICACMCILVVSPSQRPTIPYVCMLHCIIQWDIKSGETVQEYDRCVRISHPCVYVHVTSM